MTSTRRIAVTGTDGTGKTTVIRRIAARFADRPDYVWAFRAPQYHEHPDHPFGLLSASIDALSVLGDRVKNPQLKATALFLSMTLYGDVEAHLARTYRPEFLIAERQCLADSLTYARFYLPLLQAPLDRDALAPKIAEALRPLHAQAFNQVEAWVRVFQERSDRSAGTFWELPLYLRDLFNLPPDALLAHLKALYHTEIPDHIVVLTVTPDALAARLAEKAGGPSGGEAPKELHEQAHVLAMFQAGLLDSCALLKRHRGDLLISPLDTSDQSIDQTENSVLRTIGDTTA